ncbi:hypothetical protein FRC00_013824 [Tulasnella sp. 408]|nr:hypothetical protein FRC00_013824 [Tulasnella sp. 408]
MDYTSSRNPPSRKLLEDVWAKRLAFREVVYVGSDGPLVKQAFENLLFAPAPHLQSVDLVVYGGCAIRSGHTNSEHAEMDSVATSNLTSVRLLGVSIPWNAAFLRGLRSLSLEFLGRSNSNARAPTLRELVKILESCPDLQYLTLRSVTCCPDDLQEAPTGISLNRLMSLHLSGPSLQPTCNILQCIQYPKTTTLSVRVENLGDGWQVELAVILSQLTQNWITTPIHLKVDGPRVTLSAKNFRFGIPSPNEERENTGSRIAFRELFSSLGAPTLAAITSLLMDPPACQNSTPILTAANEFFPNFNKLLIPSYQRLKSKKPWHVVLEKVVQSTDENNGPVCLCPKLTSLEFTATDRPDLLSILQLVRTRTSDRKFKGKRVTKSPITSIHMNIDSGKLPSEELSELQGEVTDLLIHLLSTIEMSMPGVNLIGITFRKLLVSVNGQGDS